MHDHLNGVVTSIAISHNKSHLFTAGRDGNIFSYRWNVSLSPVDDVQEPYPPADIGDLSPIEFEDPIKAYSLEDEKIKFNRDTRERIANERKDAVRLVLSDYEMQFREIVRRNRELVQSQRVPDAKCELDARITEMLNGKLDDLMKLVHRRLAYDVEKSKLLAKKVKEYFVETIDTVQIQVKGIVTSERIKSFRIAKLSEQFWFSKNYVEEMIKLEAERRR